MSQQEPILVTFEGRLNEERFFSHKGYEVMLKRTGFYSLECCVIATHKLADNLVTLRKRQNSEELAFTTACKGQSPVYLNATMPRVSDKFAIVMTDRFTDKVTMFVFFKQQGSLAVFMHIHEFNGKTDEQNIDINSFFEQGKA